MSMAAVGSAGAGGNTVVMVDNFCAFLPPPALRHSAPPPPLPTPLSGTAVQIGLMGVAVVAIRECLRRLGSLLLTLAMECFGVLSLQLDKSDVLKSDWPQITFTRITFWLVHFSYLALFGDCSPMFVGDVHWDISDAVNTPLDSEGQRSLAAVVVDVTKSPLLSCLVSSSQI
jgi:hypothetical protein